MTCVIWNLASVCLETMLVSVHLMELLNDVCHMESRFGPFGDIVKGPCLVLVIE